MTSDPERSPPIPGMPADTCVPADLRKVSLDEAWEVEYWTKSLGSTEQELKDALGAVGTEINAVLNYLNRKDPPPDFP